MMIGLAMAMTIGAGLDQGFSAVDVVCAENGIYWGANAQTEGARHAGIAIASYFIGRLEGANPGQDVRGYLSSDVSKQNARSDDMAGVCSRLWEKGVDLAPKPVAP